MAGSNYPARRSILPLRTRNDSTNDDEAERQSRRQTLSSPSVSNNSTDAILNEEQLKNCLQIYHDNKINKDNAWSMTLIDNFSKLLSKHHKSASNFQVIGVTLDATSRIYALRVDSVHMDVLRISSGLGRYRNDRANNNDDNDEEDENNDHHNGNDPDANDGDNPAPKPKKKRVRRAVCTVTKNKESLNAPLDTIPLPDPLFSKLNSIMGDVSSSNRLLLNILPTDTSSLKLTLEKKYWDASKHPEIAFKDENLYDIPENELIDKPIDWNISTRNQMRQHLCGYTVTNTPIDDEEEEEPHTQNHVFNQSQLDYAFDINAEVEVEPENENYVMAYDMDDGMAGDGIALSAEDRDALQLCKGLRRQTNIIEDLRPADTSKLEYSYRPMDHISQFWAGPSYWKFRKSRKLTINSNATADSIANANAASVKRRQARINTKVSFTEHIEEEDDDSVFVPENGKIGQRLKNSNLYRRFDAKKLKLPTDLHIDRSLFDTYVYAPGANKMAANSTTAPQVPPEYDHADTDNEFEAAPADDHHADHADDGDIDHEATIMEVPQMPDFDDLNEPQENVNESVHEIRKTMHNAPEMIQKIDIQFAKRAKVIDMKQMKTCCLQSINKQCDKNASKQLIRPQGVPPDEQYKDGVASFSHIYHTLPSMLSKTMAENLTPSVAFYSILHLANENRLRLYKSAKADDPNTFLIRKIQ